MPLSNAVVREHAEGLNTLFNAEQATLLLALVNAAVDAASGEASAVADDLAALELRVEALEDAAE